ncbi:sulfatase-like hydrolase/transferase [Rubellicoccus peritrichatus]|uniref:Sulfatase-like hydrolase/transferase n=1 Tax=Rubellicoccus peritrichatus TaxID=3080537 RepID=A0AAQ3QTE0_9BACT|nr:sulfatase-like hydrolase/transferase [Puniceicoccus sp. CR14]WOO41236.1 sulfatase-like hydrolase/transferase [Puniceicoccus sp. CR14]
MSRKPRAIVIIQSDQHRADCLGIAGYPGLQTPNLDRLAQNGILFRNAFSPAPVCVPARSCLESSQWPCQHEVIHNWDGPSPKYLSPDISTWAKAFTSSSWTCDYIGRWHVHPNKTPVDYGYSSYLSDHNYYQWRIDQGLVKAPEVSAEIGVSAFLGSTDSEIAPEASQLSWLTDQVISKIEERMGSNDAFLIRLDTFAPHLPNRVPEPYASMYPPESLEPWGSFVETFQDKPYIQKQQLKTWNIDQYSWKDWAPTVSRYLGEITLLDHQIGRIMDTLKAHSILDDTLIVYTSDHGDMCGGHRMLDKHFIMYDDVTRVPLIAHWPNGIKSNNDCNAFISSAVDLGPTLCEIAEVKIPESFRGTSYANVFRDETFQGREDIYSTYDGNQFGLYTQRMIRNKRWKYVWNATDIDELYDLEEDPHELSNLVNNTHYADTLSQLRKRLVHWLEETKDPMANAWIVPTLLEDRIQ